MITQDIKYNSNDSLILGDGVQTDSVVPTAATAYKRGDLVKVDPATNVASHPIDVGEFNVIILADVTADQADAAITAGFEIPVYTQGEINVNEVSLNGVKLDAGQKTKARGRANTATSIELRKPFGAQ